MPGLFECTQVDDLCPGLGPADGPAFVDGCIENCEQNPAVIAVVDDAHDCVGTVEMFKELSSEFKDACDGN